MSWIDSAQANLKWHYAHTSHGGQLTTGLERIENNDPAYDIARGFSTLPGVPDALCIFDGQEGDTYISPEEYWRTAAGMNLTRDVLNHNPTINVSQWSWCCQPNSYSANDIQAYLDSISVLEAEFPEVTFIYMTGNAQTGPGNHYNQNLAQGYNRYLRNEQTRDYCIANNKVLFDFADIDCWWYNSTSEEWELSTYEYWNGSDSVTVPFEHPQYNINQAAHTSYENCENKGKAVWWMMAELAGWDSLTGLFKESSGFESYSLSQNYPNPFDQHTDIRYTIPKNRDKLYGPEKSGQVILYTILKVYDVMGNEIATLVDEQKQPGEYEVEFDGSGLPAGIYYYRLTVGNFSQTRKMILY
ncbi:MAG: T9SS type A sorting domain-containing protein [Bacteroidetes bacterium]|nr:T9SS type A sorting domain-containing protein [Bacteroidota bacterium]